MIEPTHEWCCEHERHESIPACLPLDIDENQPDPCQPIGCDNGYHLAGCVYDNGR